jgi:allantoin racemase
MRIAFIHTIEGYDEDYIQRESKYLLSYAAPDTEVDIRCPKTGVRSIENRYDECIAAPRIVDEVKLVEKEGFNAAIIACFLGTGMQAAREIVSIPVLSSGHASIVLAGFLGNRFSILTSADTLRHLMIEFVGSLGFESKLSSVRTVGIPVADIIGQEQAVLERLHAEAVGAIEQDNAEVILLGCGVLAALTKKIQSMLDTPVVNPYVAALKTAEALVKLGL